MHPAEDNVNRTYSNPQDEMPLTVVTTHKPYPTPLSSATNKVVKFFTFLDKYLEISKGTLVDFWVWPVWAAVNPRKHPGSVHSGTPALHLNSTPQCLHKGMSRTKLFTPLSGSNKWNNLNDGILLKPQQTHIHLLNMWTAMVALQGQYLVKCWLFFFFYIWSFYLTYSLIHVHTSPKPFSLFLSHLPRPPHLPNRMFQGLRGLVLQGGSASTWKILSPHSPSAVWW